MPESGRRGRPKGTFKPTRRCQYCKQDKPREDFYKNGKYKANVCKGCNNEVALLNSYKKMLETRGVEALRCLMYETAHRVVLMERIVHMGGTQ